MSLTSLKITEGSWQLHEARFDDLNLLVGISGVGKTRILRALQLLRRIGLKGTSRSPSITWEMRFFVDGCHYVWKGIIQSKSEEKVWIDKNDDGQQEENAVFLNEFIEKDGVTLVERDHARDCFLFKDKALPKLKWTESAIALLANEEDLAPLRTALQFITDGERDSVWHFAAEPHTPLHWDSLAELQLAIHLQLVIRSKELQDKYTDKFSEIKDYFIDIFPFVEDVRIVSAKEYFPQRMTTPFDIWTVAIKEKDVNQWIMGRDLSTGMLRTLRFLLEMALVPKGTLFLVDEFENSLGINCLPQVAEMVQHRQGEIQFILTSHHPYVIHNIPWEAWKLVTRRGGKVTIRSASEIPALQTASSLDRFYQLINAPEYEEGIASLWGGMRSPDRLSDEE